MKIFGKKNLLLTILFSASIIFGPGFTTSSNAMTPKILKKGKILYVANTVIVKYKTEAGGVLRKNAALSTEIQSFLPALNVVSVNSTFKQISPSSEGNLKGIMTVEYNSSEDPFLAASKIRKLNGVEWAEPRYVRQALFVPNDTLYSQQYNLPLVNAPQAWDVTKGDTSIIIGIVDTGVDWLHPDLRANMWSKIGYDLGGLNGTPDNNPIEDSVKFGGYHGTFVAGVADAVTDNVTGVAGMAYNCRIMAVKASRSDMRDSYNTPYIYYGFEGIKYAVDHGAKVINCSWGGYGFSQLEQDVINYAVNNGAVVVAAAGNDNSSDPLYPAGYNGVLSVAATDQNDVKSYFSNYGPTIDVTAPGQNLVSTWQPAPHYYYNGAGTSFASPLVAGLAALVISKFPDYKPLQIEEQIRVNCDNIDSHNAAFQYQLGSGRIDAYKAVTETNSESVRATSVVFSDDQPGDNGDGAFQPGETISVGVKFMNYLNPLNGLTATLVSNNPYSTVDNGTFQISNLGTLDSTDNYSSKFTFALSKTMPNNAELDFILKYSDGTYSDFQLISTIGNQSYATQSGNNIALTLTSKGVLGFNDFPNNLDGSGFRYLGGDNLLFEGALMFGTSASTIEDVARGAGTNSGQDTSFSTIQNLKIAIPGTNADQQGTAIFNDNGAGANKLGIITRQISYSWSGDPYKNFIILKYRFANNSSKVISNFYAGLFFDWDMVESSGDNDTTAYDNTGNLAYVYHIGGNPNTWIGTALVSDNNYGYWGIENGGTDGGFQIYDGFSDTEKWQALSSGIGKAKAGPGDISEVTSGGPYTIQPGDTLDVAFAIAAGANIQDLRNSIATARFQYNRLITDVRSESGSAPLGFGLEQNYPNPFNPSTIINYSIPKSEHVVIKVYDIMGNVVSTLVDENKPAGHYNISFSTAGMKLASGVYFYRIAAGDFTATKKLLLLK